MPTNPQIADDDEIIPFGTCVGENRDLIHSSSTAARWLREEPDLLPKTFKLGNKRFTTRRYVREWRARVIAGAQS